MAQILGISDEAAQKAREAAPWNVCANFFSKQKISVGGGADSSSSFPPTPFKPLRLDWLLPFPPPEF